MAEPPAPLAGPDASLAEVRDLTPSWWKALHPNVMRDGGRL